VQTLISKVRILLKIIECIIQMIIAGGEYGTALYAASFTGKMDTVRLLLESGADPNLRGMVTISFLG
jgi:ankyrin repeat protein